ncbi:hypothetical protein MMC20_006643 [Loxospora ochrophaea]|nr:hypothetical protein [Loxospora ochrophaea]
MVDPRQTRSVSPAKSRPPPDYYPRPPRRPQQRMPPPNLDDYLTLEELEQTAPRRRLRYLAPPEVYDYYATERRFDVKPRPQQETKLAPPKLSNYLTVEQIQIEDVRGRRRDRGRRRPIPSMLDYLTLEQLEDHWVKQDTFKGAIDIPQRAQALDESPSFRSRQSPLRQVPKSRWHMPLSSHQEDEQTPRGPLPSP